jgi:glutamine amidotransferase/cyclase
MLDYGAGNVRSVMNAIENLGAEVSVARGPRDIESAEKLVFPGVGNFGQMMEVLREKGYIEPLLRYLKSGRPFLGICLGLQALFEESEEAPGIRGLGLIPGSVRRFDVGLSVPHIGWNGVEIRQQTTLFNGLKGDEKLYFVHSYHVEPRDPSVVLTTTTYGRDFVSSIQAGSILATQFHPEKSGAAGLCVFRNFISAQGTRAAAAAPGRGTRLAKRIAACLDVRTNDAGELVVTKGDQYDVRERGEVRNHGKPVDLARRYYEEGADEIAFLNITGFRAFPLEDAPMLEVLRQTSRHVFVPLTIGGGIRDYTDTDGRAYSALEVAAEYFRSGADKISIGSDAVAVVEDYIAAGGQKRGKSAIEAISSVYGNQAVVISIDPRRVYVKEGAAGGHRVIETAVPGPNGERFCWFQCTVKGGREGRPVDAVTLAEACEALGAGEILLNSIDRDGTNSGFDIELINAVADAVTIPVIASSGAGRASHFLEVFTRTEAEAALAAGIFHRREVPIASVKDLLSRTVEVRL